MAGSTGAGSAGTGSTGTGSTRAGLSTSPIFGLKSSISEV